MVNKVESQLLVIMLKTTAAHQFCRINSAITVSHQTEKTKTVQLATAYASAALVRAFEVQNLQRCLPACLLHRLRLRQTTLCSRVR